MSILLVTTPTIDGYNIINYLGPVFSSKVLNPSWVEILFGDSFSKNLNTSELETLYQDLLNGLRNQAAMRNGNAVIGISIQFEELLNRGNSCMMAIAIGTVVEIEKEDKSLDERLKFAKILHELYIYRNDGILSEEEYNFEKSRILGVHKNYVKEDCIHAALEREQIENLKIQLELKEKQKEELMQLQITTEREKQAKLESLTTDMQRFILDFITDKKDDINSVTAVQANVSSYESLLPAEYGELRPYDVIRYLIAKGNTPAAAKFYMDKFRLSFEDAKEYIVNIMKYVQ